MKILIDIETEKEYIPKQGELDPNSTMNHDVMVSGRRVSITSRQLLIDRGLVREEEGEDVVIGEVVEGRFIKDNRVINSKPTAKARTTSAAGIRAIFQRVPKKKKTYFIKDNQPGDDRETDPCGYECC